MTFRNVLFRFPNKSPELISWLEKLPDDKFHDWLDMLPIPTIKRIFIKYLQSTFKPLATGNHDFEAYSHIYRTRIKYLNAHETKCTNSTYTNMNNFIKLPTMVAGEIVSYLSENDRMLCELACKDLLRICRQPNSRYHLLYDNEFKNLLKYKIVNINDVYPVQSLTIDFSFPFRYPFRFVFNDQALNIKQIFNRSPHLQHLQFTAEEGMERFLQIMKHSIDNELQMKIRSIHFPIEIYGRFLYSTFASSIRKAGPIKVNVNLIKLLKLLTNVHSISVNNLALLFNLDVIPNKSQIKHLKINFERTGEGYGISASINHPISTIHQFSNLMSLSLALNVGFLDEEEAEYDQKRMNYFNTFLKKNENPIYFRCLKKLRYLCLRFECGIFDCMTNSVINGICRYVLQLAPNVMEYQFGFCTISVFQLGEDTYPARNITGDFMEANQFKHLQMINIIRELVLDVPSCDYFLLQGFIKHLKSYHLQSLNTLKIFIQKNREIEKRFHYKNLESQFNRALFAAPATFMPNIKAIHFNFRYSVIDRYEDVSGIQRQSLMMERILRILRSIREIHDMSDGISTVVQNLETLCIIHDKFHYSFVNPVSKRINKYHWKENLFTLVSFQSILKQEKKRICVKRVKASITLEICRLISWIVSNTNISVLDFNPIILNTKGIKFLKFWFADDFGFMDVRKVYAEGRDNFLVDLHLCKKR